MRKGHVQTTASFRRRWKKASFSVPYFDAGEAVDADDVSCQNLQPAPQRGSSLAACNAASDSHAAEVQQPPWYAAGSAVDVKTGRGAISRASKPALKRPKLLMLVGIPGSGKSTFTKALVSNLAAAAATRSKRHVSARGQAKCPWVVVSQDDVGSRRGCEEAVGAVLGGQGRKASQSVTPSHFLDSFQPSISSKGFLYIYIYI